MQIVRCETLTKAAQGQLIEIRDTGGNCFMLLRNLAPGESLLTGPFPTAVSAEQAGIDEARRRGIEVLNVVHTAP
jgi:hypothetical protein